MNSTTKIPADMPKSRLLSLDALRGFDMIWIVGGATLINTIERNFPSEWMTKFNAQFLHVPWEGLHFFDLIFPLFMFISGATIPLAILTKLEKGSPKRDQIIKIAKRMILLIILGTIHNGTLRDGFENARYSSILAQIGIAYFFAALIVIHTKSIKSRLIWLVSILVGYAAIQFLVPVPGYGAGDMSKEGCINVYIDTMFLPGRMGQVTYDAVGLLNIFSAIAITLMGSFAGHILRLGKYTGMKKTGILAVIGTVLVIFALIISPFYPIIKNSWTSTYNIIGGGISFLLVALFYLIIDVWGWKKWSIIFQVVGVNSIFIYMFYKMVNISFTSKFLLGWLAKYFSEGAAAVIISSGVLILVWLVLYFLYRKKIFFKI